MAAKHVVPVRGLLIAGATCLLGALLLGALGVALRTPRISYRRDFVRFHLGVGKPVEVPLEFVEVFFRGQGPAHTGQKLIENVEAANVVVRLAERAKEWSHYDVRPALGHWCDGYITIRGAWCEPIDAQLIERLNTKLISAKRQIRAEQAANG